MSQQTILKNYSPQQQQHQQQPNLQFIQNVQFNVVVTLHKIAFCISNSFINQGSISPTFYTQLLGVQIPKLQKGISGQAAFCAFRICAC